MLVVSPWEIHLPSSLLDWCLSFVASDTCHSQVFERNCAFFMWLSLSLSLFFSRTIINCSLRTIQARAFAQNPHLRYMWVKCLSSVFVILWMSLLSEWIILVCFHALVNNVGQATFSAYIVAQIVILENSSWCSDAIGMTFKIPKFESSIKFLIIKLVQSEINSILFFPQCFLESTSQKWHTYQPIKNS